MKTKVSIITFHDEDNYGAVLQAYATYRAVKELGFIPEIINLHMAHHKSVISKLIWGFKRYKFNKFRKKYMPHKTSLYTSTEELQNNPPISDVYLVGSDQTWNPNISKEYALAYFLDFGEKSQKRITYASSFGTSCWTDTIYAQKEKIQQLLSRFSTILIREDKGRELLKKEFGLNSNQVIDPVLLFPSYPELTGPIKQQNNIIVYKIKNDESFYKKSTILGKRLCCEVRSIGSIRRLRGIKTSYPESIEKWIKNIGEAKYIFTDSFHGTVLSLLYHKQFVVYVADVKLVSRITSLLNLVGLQNRICTSNDSIEKIETLLMNKIDYNTVDEILKEQRIQSLELLNKAIIES